MDTARAIETHLLDLSQRDADLRPEVFSAILDMIDDGVVLTSSDETILGINRAATEHLGIKPSEAIGKSLRDAIPAARALSLGGPLSILQPPPIVVKNSQDGTRAKFELRGKSLDCDTEFFFLVLVRPVADADRHRVDYLDPTTGLMGRRDFDRRLSELSEAARCGERHFVLFFFDVDCFKNINDELGHAAGDAALRHFASLIRSTLRPGDAVARWGGDEFAVLVSDVTEADDAVQIAERFRERMQEGIDIAGRHRVVTASVGIVLSNQCGGEISPAALLDAADRAMYTAKEAGRDGQFRLA